MRAAAWCASIRWFGLGGLLMLLAACASPPSLVGHQADAFSRTGRFAVTATEPGAPSQAVQGGFAWLDEGGRLTLDLANPLGSILARVQVTPGRAVLTRSNGQVEQAANADALVEQVVGVPVPVSYLRYWMRGQVSDSARVQRRDAQGHALQFEQQGWTVELSRFDDQGPGLLQMQRNEGARTLKVRLIVNTR